MNAQIYRLIYWLMTVLWVIYLENTMMCQKLMKDSDFVSGRAWIQGFEIRTSVTHCLKLGWMHKSTAQRPEFRKMKDSEIQGFETGMSATHCLEPGWTHESTAQRPEFREMKDSEFVSGRAWIHGFEIRMSVTHCLKPGWMHESTTQRPEFGEMKDSDFVSGRAWVQGFEIRMSVTHCLKLRWTHKSTTQHTHKSTAQHTQIYCLIYWLMAGCQILLTIDSRRSAHTWYSSLEWRPLVLSDVNGEKSHLGGRWLTNLAVQC